MSKKHRTEIESLVGRLEEHNGDMQKLQRDERQILRNWLQSFNSSNQVKIENKQLRHRLLRILGIVDAKDTVIDPVDDIERKLQESIEKIDHLEGVTVKRRIKIYPTPTEENAKLMFNQYPNDSRNFSGGKFDPNGALNAQVEHLKQRKGFICAEDDARFEQIERDAGMPDEVVYTVHYSVPRSAYEGESEKVEKLRSKGIQQIIDEALPHGFKIGEMYTAGRAIPNSSAWKSQQQEDEEAEEGKLYAERVITGKQAPKNNTATLEAYFIDTPEQRRADFAGISNGNYPANDSTGKRVYKNLVYIYGDLIPRQEIYRKVFNTEPSAKF